MTRTLDPVEALAQEIQTMAGVVKVKTWTGSALKIPEKRIYATFIQPHGRVAPQACVVVATRRLSTTGWPREVSYNQRYGATLDKIRMLLEAWDFRVTGEPEPQAGVDT